MHNSQVHYSNVCERAKSPAQAMPSVPLTRIEFLKDRQGRTFADVLDDPQQPFDEALEFFSDGDRQRRMEEAEIHHDRPALAGVVRELESQTAIDRFLANEASVRSKRFRQAVGVVVRIVMERRGWRKTGKKGSLGVRTGASHQSAPDGSYHNTGGLAFWFLRAERYEREGGMPFHSVRQRCQLIEANSPKQSAVAT
jgi:hypothetical protein